jgi:hypothetical protein
MTVSPMAIANPRLAREPESWISPGATLRSGAPRNLTQAPEIVHGLDRLTSYGILL